MTGIWVGLIFNFCAAIAPNTPDNTLWFGYQVDGECIPHLELTGSNLKEPQSLPDQHALLWQWIDGGVEVIIDGQEFTVLKFREA